MKIEYDTHTQNVKFRGSFYKQVLIATIIPFHPKLFVGDN